MYLQLFSAKAYLISVDSVYIQPIPGHWPASFAVLQTSSRPIRGGGDARSKRRSRRANNNLLVSGVSQDDGGPNILELGELNCHFFPWMQVLREVGPPLGVKARLTVGTSPGQRNKPAEPTRITFNVVSHV